MRFRLFITCDSGRPKSDVWVGAGARCRALEASQAYRVHQRDGAARVAQLLFHEPYLRVACASAVAQRTLARLALAERVEEDGADARLWNMLE